jgi:hypothetical protein
MKKSIDVAEMIAKLEKLINQQKKDNSIVVRLNTEFLILKPSKRRCSND